MILRFVILLVLLYEYNYNNNNKSKSIRVNVQNNVIKQRSADDTQTVLNLLYDIL